MEGNVRNATEISMNHADGGICAKCSAFRKLRQSSFVQPHSDDSTSYASFMPTNNKARTYMIMYIQGCFKGRMTIDFWTNRYHSLGSL